ncbi:MAG: site-2 protease family protein [Dehalococcoidia bacterium]|nr:site-2 protease family protein [Dehalococcoidia bacterium]HRC61988.1 site-2 protease family protein [Dehalococcoidia bacterium]
MLLRYLSVLGEAPSAFLILIGAFLISMLLGLAFHEFCHGLIANSLGDPTPKRYGRLTLDPRAHLDPVGSLLILFVGFGWARPVPVNPYNTKNPQASMVAIAAAGPLSNLLVAGLAGIPIKLGMVPFFHPFVNPGDAAFWARIWAQSPDNLIGLFLGTIVLLNVILAVFNFVPIAPLDGFRVLVGLLPRDLSREVGKYEAWGPGVLLILFMLPFLTNGQISPLFDIMAPPIEFFLHLFAGDSGGLRVA